MHHGNEDQWQGMSAEQKRKLRDLEESAKELGLGATGRYTGGKLNYNDEGEIKIGITVQDGKVIIHFGKPIAWIGFDAEQAIELGKLIEKRGKQLRQGKLS